jgi:hypothetical protein
MGEFFAGDEVPGRGRGDRQHRENFLGTDERRGGRPDEKRRHRNGWWAILHSERILRVPCAVSEGQSSDLTLARLRPRSGQYEPREKARCGNEMSTVRR